MHWAILVQLCYINFSRLRLWSIHFLDWSFFKKNLLYLSIYTWYLRVGLKNVETERYFIILVSLLFLHAWEIKVLYINKSIELTTQVKLFYDFRSLPKLLLGSESITPRIMFLLLKVIPFKTIWWFVHISISRTNSNTERYFKSFIFNPARFYPKLV